MARRVLSDAEKQARAAERAAHRAARQKHKKYILRELTFEALGEIPYQLELLEGDIITDWVVKDRSVRNFVMLRGIDLPKRDRQQLIQLVRKIVLRRDRMLWSRLERQSKELGLEVFQKENPDPHKAPESILCNP